MLSRVPLASILLSLALLASDTATRCQAPASECAPADLSQMQVVPLLEGAADLDLDGDGLVDKIFVAWRENFNAHGFYYITFYNRTSEGNKEWGLVPFFNDSHQERDSLITSQGADCVLSDLRVLRPKGLPKANVIVVVGEREVGDSYATPAKVYFTIYELIRGDGSPGEPPLYFKQCKTIVGKHKYCDINKAFLRELGVGGTPTGGRGAQ